MYALTGMLGLAAFTASLTNAMPVVDPEAAQDVASLPEIELTANGTSPIPKEYNCDNIPRGAHDISRQGGNYALNLEGWWHFDANTLCVALYDPHTEEKLAFWQTTHFYGGNRVKLEVQTEHVNVLARFFPCTPGVPVMGWSFKGTVYNQPYDCFGAFTSDGDDYKPGQCPRGGDITRNQTMIAAANGKLDWTS